MHTAEMLWYRIVNYDSSVVNLKITVKLEGPPVIWWKQEDSTQGNACAFGQFEVLQPFFFSFLCESVSIVCIRAFHMCLWDVILNNVPDGPSYTQTHTRSLTHSLGCMSVRFWSVIYVLPPSWTILLLSVSRGEGGWKEKVQRKKER